MTEKIRRHPYSVVLFDEIEKAHPDVFNILLQVLEDGILTDSQGRRVDFRNTVLILTSNVGASLMKSSTRALGFSTDEGTQNDLEAKHQQMMQALKSTFRPEFLNRIDDIIIFNSLTKEDIEAIATLMLRDVLQRIEALGVTLTVSPSALQLLADQGFDSEFGARPLRRAIVRMVEDAFSTQLLEGNIKAGDRVVATAVDGTIEFQKN